MSTLNVDKVDPSTGTALEIGTSGDTITVPSGATFVVAGTTEITGTNNVQRPNAKPLIINGDMAVAQRSTSTAGITTSAGYYASDRYQWAVNHDGTVTITQENVAAGDAFEDGFPFSEKIDVTTADASMAAAQYAILRTTLEGQNLQLFKKGTASAETYTLSFWVKNTKTGTNIVELWDNTNSRNSHASYTIDTTNTWEKKVLNFPADTTGVIANTNAGGMIIGFYVAAGSDFTSGTLNTAWAANVNANRAVGQVNNLDSTSNNFEITGVQLEVGEYTSSTLPPFQHESYGDNLIRCQRYYYMMVQNEPYGFLGVGGGASTTSLFVNSFFPVTMRTTPTIDVSSGTDYFAARGSAFFDTFDTFTLSGINSSRGAIILSDSNFSGVADDVYYASTNSTSAYLGFTAEL